MEGCTPESEAPQIPDYYYDLGLQKTAKFQEIKKAYHSLAKKHHPDKMAPGKLVDAHEFRTIQKAYEILRDSQERSEYDKIYPQLRAQWVKHRRWQETMHQNEQLKRAREAARRHRAAEAEKQRKMEEEQRAAKQQAERKAKDAAEKEARRKAEEEQRERKRELRAKLAEERSQEAARKAREQQERAARERLRKQKEAEAERLHKQKESEAERKSEEAAKRAREEQKTAAEERLKNLVLQAKQKAIRQNWAGLREAAELRKHMGESEQLRSPRPVASSGCIHPQFGWPKRKGKASCIFCGATCTKFSFHCPECNAAACGLCKKRYCVY